MTSEATNSILPFLEAERDRLRAVRKSTASMFGARTMAVSRIVTTATVYQHLSRLAVTGGLTGSATLTTQR